MIHSSITSCVLAMNSCTPLYADAGEVALSAEERQGEVDWLTYGCAEFTQPRYLVLPHSRVPFRLARGRSDICGDARSFDGFGLDVDVVLSLKAHWSEASLLARVADLSKHSP